LQVAEPALTPATILRLIDLYTHVNTAGGIVHCLSLNLFKDVISRFRVDWSLRTEVQRTYLLIYINYLLKIEINKLGFHINSYCPLNIGYPEFWDAFQYRNAKLNNPKLLSGDLLVLESFDVQSRLDQRLFTPEYLLNHYG
jgi:hypothetical protein